MTRAVILAAGQGTRLRPLTDDRPKCMVPLLGRTLLDRQCSTLRAAGVTDITIVAGYRADLIPRAYGQVVVSPDFLSTNMVRSFFCASELLTGGTDVLVVYGDIVFERRVVEAVLACTAPICVAVDSAWRRYWSLRMEDPLADAETLKLDAAGNIVELGKKPRGYGDIAGQYIGLFKVRADHAARLQAVDAALDRDALYDGKSYDQMFMTSFMQHLIDLGWALKSVPIDNGWLEVDTVSDLRLYEGLARGGGLSPFFDADDAPGTGGTV